MACLHTRVRASNQGMLICVQCGKLEPHFGKEYSHERTLQKAKEMLQKGEIVAEVSAECDMPFCIVELIQDSIRLDWIERHSKSWPKGRVDEKWWRFDTPYEDPPGTPSIRSCIDAARSKETTNGTD